MIREVLNLRDVSSLAPGEAAAMWMARRCGGIEVDDDPGFREWIDASRANRQAWQEAEAALRCFNDSDEDELLQEIRRAALMARPQRVRRWAPGAIAASLAAVASASLLLVDRKESPPTASVVARAGDPLSRFGPPDLVTAKGEQKQISLPDGSRLALDTDTAVDVAFGAGQRGLVLAKGRALFDVQSDPGRPFKVRAGDRQVVALGTRFDVRVDPGQVSVTLFEGRVSVFSNDGSAPVELKAGEQFVQRGASARVLAAEPAEDALAWRQGLVVFNDETLGAAVNELNRYSSQALVIRDPKVARMRVSGAFKGGDPARFARTVSTIHPLRVVRHKDGSIELSPQG
jgi:transmembrane sensor